MQQLRFVGVHDDGEHLIFESTDGEHQFRAYIDSSLRNAVVKARRVHPARSLSGDGVFGPRDIQTRFRQGATVEEIVSESGWKPERVRRYEWPILAERSHVVTAARAVPVDSLDPRVTRRRTLNDQVVAVREHWHCAENEAQWNSWQREDGLWNVTVSIEYSRPALNQLPDSCDFPARFVYNPANQTVTAANAVAEFLLGKLPHSDAVEAAVEEPARQLDTPSATAAGTDQAPVSPGADSSESTDTPSVDEVAPAAEERPERRHLSAVSAPRTSPTEELLDELEDARGTRPDESSRQRVESLSERVLHEENRTYGTGGTYAAAAAAGVAHPAAEQEGPGRHAAPETSEEKADQQEADPRRAAPQDSRAQDSAGTDAGEENAADPEPSKAQHSPGSKDSATKTKPKRPSVPSWDDIVFGQQRRR